MCVSHQSLRCSLGEMSVGTAMHSLVQQDMYRVPPVCQEPVCSRHQCEKWQTHSKSFGQPVINMQWYSSGLSKLLGASFSYIPTPLADRLVIFDPVLNFYYVLYWFPTFQFLNIFLSFLLPPLLPTPPHSNNFSSLWTISWPLNFHFCSFGWGSAPGTSCSLAEVCKPLFPQLWNWDNVVHWNFKLGNVFKACSTIPGI